MKRVYGLVILLIVLGVSHAEQTGGILGKVIDDATELDIFNVRVEVVGTEQCGSTDFNGEFVIGHLEAGLYTLKFAHQDYDSLSVSDVLVSNGLMTELTLQRMCKVEDETDWLDHVLHIIPGFKLDEEGVIHARGGRAEAYNINLPPPGPRPARPTFTCPMPMVLPADLEEYSPIRESGFLDVYSSPLSTFSIDVDAASYSNVRRFLMQDLLPQRDVVRSEELINYFDYAYPQPESEPVAIHLEHSQCPWNSAHELVQIGLQGRDLDTSERAGSNLVFLLDVSGSMMPENKLPLVKRSLKLLVDRLQPEDRVALVMYAGNAGIALRSTPGNHKTRIKEAIDKLGAGGSTAGAAGIELAYKLAGENFSEGGNNRIVLATDGDFNVGVSSTGALVELIEEKRKSGIFLTVLGYGMDNYKDGRMQELADRGNGNHYYIDNIMEAKKVLVTELSSTLHAIAKDVKIQVEFNPARVASYRLVGYENRELEDRDFTDDTKDAGEMGAGHTVTALYEILPAADETPRGPLKYTKQTPRKGSGLANEVLTVRVRYKGPDGDTSREIAAVLEGDPQSWKKCSKDFRFAASVAEFAMLLRDSEHKGASSISSARDLALAGKGEDPYGYRSEFIRLIDRAELLMEERGR